MKRSLSFGLAVSLLLASLPAEASRVVRAPAAPARAGVPLAVAAVPALGSGLAAPGAVLPSPSAVSLAAPLAVAPAVLSKPAAAPSAPAAALAAAADAPAPASALAGLESGASRVAEAAREGARLSPARELDSFFEASARRSGDEGFAVSGAVPGPAARLSAASDAPRAPRLSPEAPEPAPAPRASWSRTFALGAAIGFSSLLVHGVIAGVAASLGWSPNSNYESPLTGMGEMSALRALGIGVAASVLAPVAEEPLFRGMIQGGMALAAAKLFKNPTVAFLASAIPASLIFVAVHETSDPVLFAGRLIQSLMFAWLFHKHGVLSSMVAHGVANGTLVLPFVLFSIHPLLGVLAVPAVVYAAWKTVRALRAQKEEAAAGRLSAVPFTIVHAALAIVALLAGFALIMPNQFWVAGALVLAVWTAMKLFGRKARSS